MGREKFDGWTKRSSRRRRLRVLGLRVRAAEAVTGKAGDRRELLRSRRPGDEHGPYPANILRFSIWHLPCRPFHLG